jgi:hypothetical protein
VTVNDPVVIALGPTEPRTSLRSRLAFTTVFECARWTFW